MGNHLDWIMAIAAMPVIYYQFIEAVDVKGKERLKSLRGMIGLCGNWLIGGGAMGIAFMPMTGHCKDAAVALLLGQCLRTIYLWMVRRNGGAVA